jgi:hypothetical protein
MDVVVGAVLVAALMVVVAVAALLVTRGPLKLTVRGPFRTGVDVEGKAPVGVRLKRVRAGRDVSARGHKTVDASRVRAGQDVIVDDPDGGQRELPKG